MRQHSTQLQHMSNTLEKHQNLIGQVGRAAKSKNLVLYGVPDAPEGNQATNEAQDGGGHSLHRLSRYSAKQSKPRPLRLCFPTLQLKHQFLTRAEEFRALGIRCDGDLTRKQQQQRDDQSADFLILKSKGYSPFLRGSQLRYCSHVTRVRQAVYQPCRMVE